MEITGFFGVSVPHGHYNAAEGAFNGASRPAGYNGTSYNAGTNSPSTPIYGYELRASRNWTGETSSKGGNQSHNNMPPWYGCVVWKRVS